LIPLRKKGLKLKRESTPWQTHVVNCQPAPALLFGGVHARVLMKARPLPLLGPLRQTSFHRIQVDIRNGLSYDRYIFVNVDLLRPRSKLEERDFGRMAIALSRSDCGRLFPSGRLTRPETVQRAGEKGLVASAITRLAWWLSKRV
jgi:hypothetical protein